MILVLFNLLLLILKGFVLSAFYYIVIKGLLQFKKT